MNRVTGGSLPASIWRDVMQAAHAGKSPLALPSGLAGDRLEGGRHYEGIAGSAGTGLTREMLPWQNPRVVVPGGSDPPRPQAARERNAPAGPAGSETKPSLARATASGAGQRPAVRPPAPKSQAHPRERIDADFIDRVLKQSEPQLNDVADGGSRPPSQSRTPPEGMMSLGGRQDEGSDRR